jgi:hypothetical protein
MMAISFLRKINGAEPLALLVPWAAQLTFQ